MVFIYKSRPGTTSKFSSRTNAGEVVAKYPSGDVAIDWDATSDGSNKSWQPRVQPAHWNSEPALTTQKKYMFSRLRDKYEILEDQVLELGAVLAKQLKVEDWTPNNTLQSVSV